MNITKTEGTFPSSNGTNMVHYTVWTPDCTPSAMIQLSHGMCEHMGRYDATARALCEQGYIVFGNDHIGHGRSVKSDDELGYFAPEDGDLYLVRDLAAMNRLMKEKYRALPTILLGHSFGSFLARAYLMGHADSIDGLILSGTSAGDQPLKLGMKLCKFLAKRKGDHYRSPFLYKQSFGSYNKRFKPQKGKATGREWVTSDPDELKAYTDDPKCCFIFTVQGFYDLFTVLSFVNSEEWYDKVPKGLPIFFLSGEEDPVGAFGKDIPRITEALLDMDASDVTYKLYKGERHEPLTGISREEARADVAAFVERVVEGVREASRSAFWGPAVE
ncbi:MAG: alpha/beta fold hydrolase [Clostridia bacterium]|nr:alpha/beta fold hydrolase [Clostridia bacterium]